MSQRIVWITGASSGIGQALARRMAADGWTVAASARSVDALNALAAEPTAGSIRPYPLDVTDHAACRTTAKAIEHDLGAIDTVVLAAGLHIPTVAKAFDVSGIRSLVDINLMGVVHCVDAVLPALIDRGGGRLAIVASVAGYRGLPSAAGYGATKAALINFAEALKFDLDHHGITTQVVCPGFVRTPLTDRNPFPMPFLMEVEDAAERLYRGLQGASFEITFPRRFALILKFLGILPDRLYFWLMHKGTGM
ncbi:SDR family NAD(P)-dependent oxidoreductase [Thalassobaculum sp.]|uniref:SDR family NAD(P)-dependent oxidoreductase n=1 Tax=Thalassobaculum sp. TaxID=2022740 RepID=UPI0032EC31BE